MLGELNHEEIEQLLRNQMIGRIGCHVDGETYIVPVTYVYDGECIYAHSGEGRKIHMMRINPEVCFEVDHMENMANWQSVIAQGRYEELHGEEAIQGMQRLVARLAPVMASETSQPTHGMEAAITHRQDISGIKAVAFRIRLQQKTGRFEKR